MRAETLAAGGPRIYSLSWLLLVCLSAVHAPGQEVDDLRKKVADLTGMVQVLTGRVSELEGELGRERVEKRGQALEDAILEMDLKVGAVSRRMDGLVIAAGQTRSFIEISFNSLFAAGTSTASEEELRSLHAGGHDPRKRGFTVQNEELTFQGAVDPWFRGEAHIILFIDGEGETVVELEEAFLTTLALPADLQIKAGMYFTEFGRLNPRHPHGWSFVDQPVILSRFFGPDGLRAPGARLSWLAPVGFPLEILGGVQNANGETAVSFLSSEEAGMPGGRPFIERDVDSFEDLLWSTRAVATLDLSSEVVLAVGASGAFGPNAAGRDTNTAIWGLDVFLEWRPLDAEKGFPFVTFQSEFLWREMGADLAILDPEAPEEGPVPVVLPGGDLHDFGFYAEVNWGFSPGWVLGLRGEYAGGGDSEGDFLREERIRLSAALTHYVSEFSKIRFQTNFDDSDFLEDGDAVSVWLQIEWILGSHGAHRF